MSSYDTLAHFVRLKEETRVELEKSRRGYPLPLIISEAKL